MSPRLYLQDIQYATYKADTQEIWFQMRHVTGGNYHFILSREQFLALDDALIIIDNSHRYGDYPLGQHMWLRYHNDEVTLYRNTRHSGRIHFHFERFEDYKSYVHKRLYSFIDSKSAREVTRRRYHGRFPAKTHKRSISDDVWSTNQPSTSKRHCRSQRKTSPRSSVHAHYTNEEKVCDILSEWNNSNSRRRSESSDSTTDNNAHLESPVSLRHDSFSNHSSMESQ